MAIAGSGGGTAVGASIGIAVARNFIGADGFGLAGDEAIATIRAQSIDSELTAEGTLSFTAEGKQGIDALVVSGSAAIALGGGNAIGVSGSGVWAENYIGTRLSAGITTTEAARERVNTVEAGSVVVRAVDASSIDAWAGAVSVPFTLAAGSADASDFDTTGGTVDFEATGPARGRMVLTGSYTATSFTVDGVMTFDHEGEAMTMKNRETGTFVSADCGKKAG